MTSQPGLQAAMSRPIWPVTPERSSGTEDDHQAMMSATTPSTSELLAPVTGQSPASTSDETTKGENTPVTPAMVKGSLSDPAVVTASMSKMQLHDHDNATNPIEHKYQRVLLNLGGDTKTACDLLADIAGESGDLKDPNDEVLRTNSVHLQVPHPTSPVRSTSMQSGNWRRPVSYSSQPVGSDPFFVGPGSSASPTKQKSASHSFSGEPKTPVKAPQQDASESANGSVYRPRKDREVAEISGDNAQAIFPPNACVFVANLVATQTDDQLEHSVTRAFEQFGKVYVKIKRDVRGMPYAFCQYVNVVDSEKAIRFGRGMLIDGRQCRTERAKVNRSLYLSRVTGGPISETEAREILTGCGDLEKLWESSPTDKEMYRLGDGIWVMFAFFQDCRDAQALFKDHAEFRLDQPVLPDDLRMRLKSPAAKTTPYRASPSGLFKHVADRTIVFVGNLPSRVSQAELRKLFASSGTVRGVEILSRNAFDGQEYKVYAFVEFGTEDEARLATTTEFTLDGRVLRVELKESTEPIRTRPTGTTATGSPRSRKEAGHVDSSNRFINRDSAIARACSVGIPASTIAQIFGLQTPEKPEQTGAINLSASPSAYGQVPYYTPFYHPAYGMYGASAAQFNDSEPNGQAYNVSNHVHPSMNYQYPQTGAAQYTQSTVGQYPQGTGQYPGYVQVSCGYPSISSEGAQPQVNLPQGERTEE